MHEINERNPLLSSKRKYSHQIASTPSLPPGPVNCSLTARQTNTSSTLASGPEHWCISEIGHMLETAIRKGARTKVGF
jgi:hypothetical protein